MRRQCRVAYFSHPTSKRSEIWTKSFFGIKSEVPFILTVFNLANTLHNAYAGSSMSQIPVTPLQFEGRKTVPASRVMCTSLLTDFNLTFTTRNTYAGSAMYFSQPTAMRGDIRTKNCSILKSEVPCVTDRLQPIVRM
jgi:hypothetical protein